ncbi:MAG TPA: nucleotidyl transferase AbiEii/AbiGii toxin family protein [Chitinophaga sp.]|uniref:nucleotidyl transferase AbiEii/AbiGii toxin family protein n=1 Tax=Chitinophaga sp. TaxID=1869181 RepID=UPI002DB9658E|nr:nucleotidyl transferase AbiEii/AbiGii toxin family protein [Chitinophaga sp.]HEU4554674.1 nucleotidyl transferase AbiEii/AbiGii toxin family protein [Chitinophaga sp.]
MSHTQNITRIKAVHQALEELANEVVFVGGATVSLYADRPAEEIRPTEDVDILIELMNYSNYAAIEEKLRLKGFANDVESGIICRYRVHGIIVDIMPTDESILGFTNKWYSEGYKHSMQISLGNNVIRIFQPAWFIGSKLEAFRNRGGNDGRMSSDFEDIVFVLNNRDNIWDEIKTATPLLKTYLNQQFQELLSNKYIYEWISAHLDYVEQRRVNYIIGGLQHTFE